MTIGIEVIAQLPGTFTDTASVTADQADPDTKNNTATVTETVIAQSADLQVSISPVTPNSGLTGLPYRYTITVTNAGPQVATNVIVQENTDSATHLQSVTTDGKITEYSLTHDSIAFATLAVGATETITIEDIADHSGTFTDTASVSADQADPNAANNTATVTETVIAPKAPPTLAPINVFASLLDRGNRTFAPFVTWGMPAGSAVVPTFVIYRSTAPGGEGTLAYATTSGEHDLVDSVGKPGVTYYYQIAEVIGGALGPRSEEAHVTIPTVIRTSSRGNIPSGPAGALSKRLHRRGLGPAHSLPHTHPVKSHRLGTSPLHVLRQRPTVKVLLAPG